LCDIEVRTVQQVQHVAIVEQQPFQRIVRANRPPRPVIVDGIRSRNAAQDEGSFGHIAWDFDDGFKCLGSIEIFRASEWGGLTQRNTVEWAAVKARSERPGDNLPVIRPTKEIGADRCQFHVVRAGLAKLDSSGLGTGGGDGDKMQLLDDLSEHPSTVLADLQIIGWEGAFLKVKTRTFYLH